MKYFYLTMLLTILFCSIALTSCTSSGEKAEQVIKPYGIVPFDSAFAKMTPINAFDSVYSENWQSFIIRPYAPFDTVVLINGNVYILRNK